MDLNNNAVIGYEALRIFRDAMLPFLVERLQACYGSNWWKAGVGNAIGDSKTDNLKLQFERQYGIAAADPSKMAELLDFRDFLHIIQRHWRPCFAEIFGPNERKTLEAWLDDVLLLRNEIAHYGQLPEDELQQTLIKMERLIRIINSSSAEKIKRLQNLGLAIQSSDSNPLEAQLLSSNLLRLSKILPDLLTVDQYFYSVTKPLKATDFIYSVFAIIVSGNPEAIEELLKSLNAHDDQISSTSLHYLLNEINAEPLMLVSSRYGSPATFDLLGVGKVLEVLSDAIKDIVWRGKHERKMSELEYQTAVEKKKIDTEKTAIEIKTEKAQIEKLKLENEKLLVEIMAEKLNLLQEAGGIDLSDQDKKLLVNALVPKLAAISNDPIAIAKNPGYQPFLPASRAREFSSSLAEWEELDSRLQELLDRTEVFRSYLENPPSQFDRNLVVREIKRLWNHISTVFSYLLKGVSRFQYVDLELGNNTISGSSLIDYLVPVFKTIEQLITSTNTSNDELLETTYNFIYRIRSSMELVSTKRKELISSLQEFADLLEGIQYSV